MSKARPNAVLVLIAAYAALVFSVLGIAPLWFDELQQLAVGRESVAALLQWVQMNPGASPLPYLAQRAAVDLFGASAFVVRIPAALCSIAGAGHRGGGGVLWRIGGIGAVFAAIDDTASIRRPALADRGAGCGFADQAAGAGRGGDRGSVVRSVVPAATPDAGGVRDDGVVLLLVAAGHSAGIAARVERGRIRLQRRVVVGGGCGAGEGAKLAVIVAVNVSLRTPPLTKKSTCPSGVTETVSIVAPVRGRAVSNNVTVADVTDTPWCS